MSDLETVTFDTNAIGRLKIYLYSDGGAGYVLGGVDADELIKELFPASPLSPPSRSADHVANVRNLSDAQSTGQEPVAWQVHPFDYGFGSKGLFSRTDRPIKSRRGNRKDWVVQPL